MTATPPPVLLPYQQQWIADQSAVKVCEKSRRVGLSWAQAAESVLSAAQASGQNSWYVGYNKDMALEFINDCAVWAKHFNAACEGIEEEVVKDEDRDIQTFRIRFASGHRVTALSSRPSNLRGKQGKVIIDEAGFHEDLSELLKAALALLMWGGQVAIISTHNGADNPFAELVEDVRSKKLPYSLHHISFEEACEQGLFKRICLKLGNVWSEVGESEWKAGIRKFYADAAEEELDCIPRGSGGSYLSRALVQQCMHPAHVLRLSMPDAFTLQGDDERTRQIDEWIRHHLDPVIAQLDAGRTTGYGYDFARNGDLSAISVFQERADLVCESPLLIELRNMPFRQQEQVLFHLVDRLPRFRGGAHDARGNGQYLAEVACQRYGSFITPVMFSVEWYRQNMPAFKAAFEDRTLLIPADSDLMADLRAIQVEKGVAKIGDRRYRGLDGGWRHGDGAIALVLGFWAMQQDHVPIEFQTYDRPRVGTEILEFLGG